MMNSEISGIFLISVWSISYSIYEVSNECDYGSEKGGKDGNFLILKLTNGSIHEIPFVSSSNRQENISCTISTELLPAEFCVTSLLYTQHSTALHTSFAVTTSVNAQNSSVSTQPGYDQLNKSKQKTSESSDANDLSYKTLYESSFGAAFTGLVFGLMITSTTCLIRERLQKQKNKAVYIQNHYEPPSQKIQMNDVYNEISDERNFKDAQQITEQLHSSMTSNTMCGVYNHLRELPADDRENNYEHVHLSKTEDPSPGHCDGAIDGVPHPDKSSDRDEVVDDNDVLLESDRFKSNENYFVLEKQSFTRESLNQKGNNQ